MAAEIKETTVNGLLHLSNMRDSNTGEEVSFTEVLEAPAFVGGVIHKTHTKTGKLVKRDGVISNVLNWAGNSAYCDGDVALIHDEMSDGDTLTMERKNYKLKQPWVVTKSLTIDFNGSTFETEGENAFIFKGTLKSTKAVAYNYITGVSNNSLVLNNTTGIEVGDLINIVSTELFNTTRLYYYKGGNATVTKINGNIVYFNLSFPFDMSATSITVQIYKPIVVTLKNLKSLKSVMPLESSSIGIRIEYGRDLRIDDLGKTDNFKYNISFFRCVDTDLNRINTGRAKSSDADNYDGYGIAIESCTNVRGSFIKTNSGQHGITNTGREPSYNLVFDNCNLKSETWNLGYGAHGNVIGIVFNNCTIHGFTLTGNFTMNNCKVPASEIKNKTNIIGLADSPIWNNATFNNCDIEDMIELRGDIYQVEAPNNRYIGNITFNNCPNFFFTSTTRFRMKGVKTASIGSIEVNDCKGYSIETYDEVGKVKLADSATLNINDAAFNQKSVTVDGVTSFANIGSVDVIRGSIAPKFGAININKADNVSFDGLRYNNTPNDANTGGIIVNNVKNLSFSHVDMSDVVTQRGLELSEIQNLVIAASKLRFRSASALATILTNTPLVSAKMFHDLIDNKVVDIVTSSDGLKYKIGLNASGRLLVGDKQVSFTDDIRDSAKFTSVLTVDGLRPVILDPLGRVNIKGSTGGWNNSHGFLGSADSALGGFGANGAADAINRFYIGTFQTDEKVSVLANGNVGIGRPDPTANLHLRAGTGLAGTAPLKLQAGTLLAVPEAGAMEYSSGRLYMTNGAVRAAIAYLTDIPKAEASANSAANVGATYSQSEVQAILNEMRDLKTKLKIAGLMS